MARKSVKQVTLQDVKLVHNLIERGIQLHMTLKEVMTTLQKQATIEPEFTKTVWQRLEEQNPEFFKAYYTRLALKQQIEEFNKLLEKQKQLMDLEQQTKVASLPTSNGFQYHVASSSLPYSNGTNAPTISENPACYYVSAQTAEGTAESRLSNVFNNGASSFGMVDMSAHGNIPTIPYSQNSNGRSSFGMVDMSVREDIPTMPYSQNSNGESSSSMVNMSAHGDIPIRFYSQNSNGESSSSMVNMSAHGDIPIRFYSQNSNGESSSSMVNMSTHGDIPIPFYSQNSNFGLQQGSNGGMTVSEPAYSISPHMFGADGNVREAGPNVGNASATSITGVESNSHPVNEAVPNLPNISSNGSLERMFSLSNMVDLDYLLSDVQDDYSEEPILDFNFDDFDLQNIPEIKEKGFFNGL